MQFNLLSLTSNFARSLETESLLYFAILIIIIPKSIAFLYMLNSFDGLQTLNTRIREVIANRKVEMSQQLCHFKTLSLSGFISGPEEEGPKNIVL